MADDFCKEFALQQERHALENKKNRRRNKLDRMNDTRIMLILFLFHPDGFRRFKNYCKEHICKHPEHLFPRRASCNRFAEPEKEAPLPLAVFIKRILSGNCTDSVLLIPLRYAVTKGFLIHKTFEGLAECGKCSMGWLFGFRLHLIINDKGEIL